MKAKDKQQYINEWENHFRQMIHVYMDAGMDWKIWERDFADTKRIIKAAAEQNEQANVFNGAA